MKRMGMKALAVLLALCAVWVLAVPVGARVEVRALFLNVGKADAALLWVSGARYLVDTGHKDSYDQLRRVLDAYDVRQLDGIIVTHTDKDHVGGLKKLLKSGLIVDRLYAPLLSSEPDADEHPVKKAAEKYGVALKWLSAGEWVEIAEGCAFEVLGPLTRDEEKENNNSLVLRLETPEGALLLTGDMELPEERELAQAGLFRQAAVLKVPHHGEGDATGKQLVLLTRPQWSIISTNTAQEPDTPDAGVLALLTAAGSGIAVTQDAEVGVLVTLEGGNASAELIDWP